MFFKITVGAALVVSTLAACSPLRMVNTLAPDDGVKVVADLAYGSDPRQRLDLYRPTEATTPLPTVLFFYGGSWKRGEREKYAFIGHSLAQHGFLVAVADYRTYPNVRFPEFVDDAALAVKWLTENAAAHGGMTTDIHLIGHSAGAHIAAFVALDPVFLNQVGLDQSVLGPWVGLAGPYAFYPSEVRSVRDIFSGVEEDMARPITRVYESAPAALLLHGGDDTTVLPSNSTALAQEMNDKGIKAAAHIYDGIGHGPLVVSLTKPFTRFAPALEDTVRFLKTGTLPEAKTADAMSDNR